MSTQATILGNAWTLDPVHTTVGFSARHMMITTVKGRFGEVEGRVTRNGDSEWTVDVTIAAASVDTRAPQRDEHLRLPDFLDAERFPHLTFRGKRIEGGFAAPGDRFRLVGDLTIRDVTREVSLDVIYNGAGTDPWGGERMSFEGRTTIDRRDFGLTWNQALEAGGVLVSNEVKIEIDVQLVKQT